MVYLLAVGFSCKWEFWVMVRLGGLELWNVRRVFGNFWVLYFGIFWVYGSYCFFLCIIGCEYVYIVVVSLWVILGFIGWLGGKGRSGGGFVDLGGRAITGRGVVGGDLV